MAVRVNLGGTLGRTYVQVHTEGGAIALITQDSDGDIACAYPNTKDARAIRDALTDAINEIDGVMALPATTSVVGGGEPCGDCASTDFGDDEWEEIATDLFQRPVPDGVLYQYGDSMVFVPGSGPWGVTNPQPQPPVTR